MIKKNQKFLNFINVVIDLILLFFSAVIVYFYGKNVGLIKITSKGKELITLFFYSSVTVSVLILGGVYSPNRKNGLLYEIEKLIILFIIGFVISIFFSYIFSLHKISRAILLFYLGIGLLFLIIKKTVLKFVLFKLRKNGYNQKHVIIVGNGALAKEYADVINKNREFGYTLDGYLSASLRDGLGKNLGTYEDLKNVLESRDIDEIVVALEEHENIYLKNVISTAEKEGVRMLLIPFFNHYIPANPFIEEVGDIKLVSIRKIPLDIFANRFIKRTFDIIFSLFVIILSSPVMLLTAVCVKISVGKDSIIYTQERVGKNKKLFKMYKFRSMKTNSHEADGWSHPEDDRRTPVGRFIRKYSIDELPQFFNVLFGDMSVVGPRPEIQHFVDQFKEEIPLYMVRHQVKPGITGWAQINGYRGDTSLIKRVKYDIYYIEHWSVLLDIKIIFLTVFGGFINKEVL